jgi:tetratricopeptide (TPR) repeat protein
LASRSPVATGPVSENSNGLSPQEIYERTLRSVAYLSNEQNQSIATAWIVDFERGLLLTNQHAIAGATDVMLTFPKYRDGKLEVDIAKYGEPTPARVVDSDQAIDLALIQVKKLPRRLSALTMAESSATPGERVHAIGGQPLGSFGLWKYSTGFVSQVSLLRLDGDRELRVMQSSIDLNPGNSGGPIVNDQGQVVGVSQSGHTEAHAVTNNVDVDTVREYIKMVIPILDGHDPEAHVELGRRHLDEGRDQVAMQLFSEALDHDPNLAEAYAQRGRAFMKSEDYVTAVNDFSEAIKLQRTNATAWAGRALAYRYLENYDQSIQDYSSAITHDPGNAGLYNQRAIAHEMKEDYRLALSDYGRALKIVPGDPQYLANRADLWNKMKEFQNGKADAEMAIQANADFAWAYSVLGAALAGMEQYSEAAESYYQAFQKDESQQNYLVQAGENVQRAGDHELGVQVWTKIIELDPENAYNYFSRGWSHRRLENYRAAVQDFNVAINMRSDDAAYFHERGLALQAMGQQEAAQQDLNRAAQMNPQQYGNNNNNASNTTTTTSVVGTWYVNQNVDGVRYEMTQVYGADGSYQATLLVTQNGSTSRTDEQGTYYLQGDQVVFNTNLGNYGMQYHMKDGMFWLLFEKIDTWLGSVRR